MRDRSVIIKTYNSSRGVERQYDQDRQGLFMAIRRDETGR
jgi:hypothetical protein